MTSAYTRPPLLGNGDTPVVHAPEVAFRVLTGNQHPDHGRVSEFRRRNLVVLSDLFVQILRLCQKAGMVSPGHIALDGTMVQANASKHKAMSHERMLKVEKQLEKEINALMRKAEILDAQEDRRYGKGNRGSDLPDELQRRQVRLARIRQARKEMDARCQLSCNIHFSSGHWINRKLPNSFDAW